MTNRGRKPSYARLAALEGKGPRRSVVSQCLAEEEWLAFFRLNDAEGAFDEEPDFPEALRAYETALAAAGQATEPPFFPPTDYLPDESDVERRRRWRGKRYYSEINDTIVPVLKITERMLKARMTRG